MSTKSAISDPKPEHFSLIETLLWEPKTGYFLLKEHLERVRRSAHFFRFLFKQTEIMQILEKSVCSLPLLPHKVRLTLTQNGMTQTALETIEIHPESLQASQMNPLVRCALATTPIHRKNLFLQHKTTRRQIYDRAKSARPDAEDVILYNEKNHITETCISNCVVQFGEKLYTPPLSCGLLAGTMRQSLLVSGTIEERIIRIEDLAQCDAIFAINSVRRWRKIELLPKEEAKTEAI